MIDVGRKAWDPNEKATNVRIRKNDGCCVLKKNLVDEQTIALKAGLCR